MNSYKKYDRVMTSFGIPGKLSQPIFGPGSNLIVMWIVTLDKNDQGLRECHQSIIQLKPL